MKNKLLAVLLAGLTLCGISTAEEPIEVAILAMEVSGGIPGSYAPALTDRLRQEIFLTGAFKVMERGEMDGILREIGFQQSGCTSNECLIEAGRILGVKQMITGTVSQMGGMHTINVRVIEVKTSEIVNIVSVDCMCSVEEVLTSQLKVVALKLASKYRVDTAEGMGSIKVASNPSGAIIFLDGKDTGVKTPGTLKEVAAGQHIIKLAKGNLASSKQVTVQKDVTSSVDVALKRGFGGVIIETVPAGAEVLIDGVSAGNAPFRMDSLSVGIHNVEVKKEGYLPQGKDFNLAMSEILKFQMELIQECGMRIESEPVGAQVYLESEKRGVTPLTLTGLKPGSYLVSLKQRGYKKFSASADLQGGGMTDFRYILTPRARSTSIVMSTLCPGLGQIYSGKHLKGSAFLFLQVFGIAGAIIDAKEHADAVDEYEIARAEYLAAIYTSDILTAKSAMDEKWDKAEEIRGKRDGMIALSVIVYLANVTDIVFFNQPPGGPSKYRFSLENEGGKTNAVLRVKF